MEHRGYDQFPSNLLGCDSIRDASPNIEILNYWSLYPVRKLPSENEEIIFEPCNGVEVPRKIRAFTSHIRQQHNSTEFCESGLSDLSPCKRETTSELHVEVKTEEVKTEEVKTEEVKTEEVKTEVKTEEVKTEEVKTEDSVWPDTPNLSENTPAHMSTCQTNEFGTAVKDESHESPISVFSTCDQPTATLAEPAALDRPPRGSSAGVVLHQQSGKLQQEITPSSANNSGLKYNDDEMLKANEKCPLCAESNGSHQEQEERSEGGGGMGTPGEMKYWKCCKCGHGYHNIWNLTYHRDKQHNCALENAELRTRFHGSQDSEKHVLTQSKETPPSQVIKTEANLKPGKREPSAHNSMQATTTPVSSKPVPSFPMLIDEQMEVKTEDSVWPDTPNQSENTSAHMSTCQTNEFGTAVKDESHESPISVFSTCDQPTATLAEPAALDRPPRGSSAGVVLHQQSGKLQQEITPSSANNSMQPTTTPGSSNSAPSGLKYNDDEILKANERCPLCAESNGSHQEQEERSEGGGGMGIRGDIKRWKCCKCGYFYHNIWNLTYHRDKQHNCALENAELRTRFQGSRDSEKHVLTQSKETPPSQVIKTEPGLKPGKRERSDSLFPMLTEEVLKGNKICPLCSKSNGTHKQEDDRKKKRIKPWKCCGCKNTFLCVSSLIRHRKIHLDSALECSECKQRFGSRYCLKKHMSTTHSKERPFPCGDCDEAFRIVSQLTQHVMFHHAPPKHICEECGKGFHLKSTLQLHMNVHTGPRPFQCPDCDSIFKTPAALKTHGIVHTGERPFPCPQCPSRFRFKGNLKNHLATHTSCQGPQRLVKRRARRPAESSSSEEASPSDTDSPHDSSTPGPTTRGTSSRKRLKLVD